MYHAVVRRRMTLVFERHLSSGDWERVLANVDEHVRHVFRGASALGGERWSRDTVSLGFERLGRLFPGHDFEVRRVVATEKISAALRVMAAHGIEEAGASPIRG